MKGTSAVPVQAQVGVERALFRDAMGRFPTGVVIVTAVANDGRPHGFTASSFTSVSLDPPLVLFCLGTGAACYGAFRDADRFGISILSAEHSSVAKTFATRGADKFASEQIVAHADGNYFVDGAAALMSCRPVKEVLSGDHGIFIAQVERVELGGGDTAMVNYRKGFHEIRVAAR